MTADRAAARRSAIAILLAAGCMAACGGCSSEPLPFKAEYISPDKVLVTYQNKEHVLNRHGSSAPVPFKYRFEEDGDLDLLIDGKNYDVDSPYDWDSSRKKTKTARKNVPAGKSGTSSRAAKVRR